MAEIKWEPIDEDETAILKKIYDPKCSPSILFDKYKSVPGGVRLTKNFVERGFNRVRNFKVRSDDVWIVSYPKCGTTMTQEIMWQIMHDVDTSVNGLKGGMTRVPFLEFCDIRPDLNPRDNYAFVDQMESPRLIKSHLPFELLPLELLDKAKVVYVARHPIDCAVSMFHHHQIKATRGNEFVASFDDFVRDMFMPGRETFGSYFHHIKVRNYCIDIFYNACLIRELGIKEIIRM